MIFGRGPSVDSPAVTISFVIAAMVGGSALMGGSRGRRAAGLTRAGERQAGDVSVGTGAAADRV